MKEKFCFQAHVSAGVTPKMWGEIVAEMKSDRVNNICEAILALDPDQDDYGAQKAELKKKLPCITVSSCGFDDGRRSNDTAHFNGVGCLEYDHVDPEIIEAFYHCEPPKNVILAGKSCSGSGVWFLVQVPDSDVSLLESSLREVHADLQKQILQKTGDDINKNLDLQVDLARLRYLPSYHYVWFDLVDDFIDETDKNQGYISQYKELHAYAQGLESHVVEGYRHTTYEGWCVAAAKFCKNKYALLNLLPDLGLDYKERMDLCAWASAKIECKQECKVMQTIAKKPIDMEACPMPFQSAPQLIKTLVQGLPSCWQGSATLCLLPSLSVAMGGISQDNGLPLVFQVALYGLSQSGKTAFSGKPARVVQEFLARNDNDYRDAIERKELGIQTVADDELGCPKVLSFSETSTVQLMKYLKYAGEKVVMCYEGDLSHTIGGDKSSFLNIQPLLRKGFDGENVVIDYKSADSFRGALSPRLSFLAIGTPGPILKYFNGDSTSEGNTRRVILVEHQMVMKNINLKEYTDEQLQYIHSELEWLEGLKKQVHHDKIEQAALAWRSSKQCEAHGDPILWGAVHTPTEMYKRMAYLCWVLNRFDESSIKDCCKMGRWLAEYQLRNYLNITYKDQKLDLQKWEAQKAPSTQKEQEQFNERMYEALPKVFRFKDVVDYRIANKYPYNAKNPSLLQRWHDTGRIAPTVDRKWVKIE